MKGCLNERSPGLRSSVLHRAQPHGRSSAPPVPEARPRKRPRRPARGSRPVSAPLPAHEKKGFEPDLLGCEGCVYWRGIDRFEPEAMKCCHYLLDHNTRRGCPPGSRCTRKVIP